MKRLLLATDLSARSDRATDRAVALARHFGASLTILNVVDDDLPARVADHQKLCAEEILSEQVGRLTDLGAATVSSRVVFGQDWKSVVDYADHEDVDLIILGLHRSEREGLFRGTTVERVMRHSAVPVLVVKDRATAPYQRVAVGIDFSIYSRRAVEFAVRFAPQARIHLIHAFEVPFKGFLSGLTSVERTKKKHELQFAQLIDEEMSGFLSGVNVTGVRLEKRIREGAPGMVIAQEVAALKADLLILGTHGRTGVAHALLGSVAETFLNDPPCDVLAVKAW